MHVQSAVDDFEVFARSLSIGAETRVMWFDPDKPMYDRYQVKHDFLTPEQGFEVETISKVVNAFFRWEFNSCESIVRAGRGVPDRLRERVAGRRRDEPALLLPVGDDRARALVRVLSCRETAHAHRRRHAAVVRDRATATTSRTRRSWARTGSSPTSTSRRTRTPSSAPVRSRTSRRRHTSGSRATSSTGCSWPRCARRSPRMSTRGSPSTTVACWPRGPATARRSRRRAGTARAAGRIRAGSRTRRARAAGRTNAVDEVREARGQRRRHLIRLRLRELAGRHVAGDLRLLCRDERRDQTCGRLAARGCRDLRERLAGLQLRQEVRRRRAEIRGRRGEIVPTPPGP